MKKSDFIVIGILLAIIVALFLIVNLSKKEGAYVVVTVDGKEVAQYSLSIDGEYELNGGSNTLRIENGKAYLIYADCPDHLCVNQGKIDKTLEAIVCLPNKVVITVYGNDTNVDLIS